MTTEDDYISPKRVNEANTLSSENEKETKTTEVDDKIIIVNSSNKEEVPRIEAEAVKEMPEKLQGKVTQNAKSLVKLP